MWSSKQKHIKSALRIVRFDITPSVKNTVSADALSRSALKGKGLVSAIEKESLEFGSLWQQCVFLESVI